VEILVVPNVTTATIAKQATTTIPIVVVGGGSLLEAGLVASLARPGGNITGIHTRARELAAKQLELLQQVVPGVTRVAVLGGLSWGGLPPELKEVARSLAMELRFFQVREPLAFANVFAAMATVHVHALLVLGDPFFAPHSAQMAALIAQHRLPSICAERSYVAAGCLMSYGFSQPDRGQRIAAYIDKILRGAQPADLPVEQPMRFEFVINLKTAQALGITFPPTLLVLADEVLQ
jgi:putative ABC transport system substrate-binding protein